MNVFGSEPCIRFIQIAHGTRSAHGLKCMDECFYASFDG